MKELPETRQSLLLELREHSNDAWSEFLQIYEQAIYDYCRSRGLQDADARDVTQEVLAAVTHRIHSWDGDSDKGHFRGWLFRVARNIAVNRFLERSRRAAASGDTRVAQMLAEVPDSTEEHSSLFWMEYRRALMHWAAEQVKPQVSDAAWCAFWMTAIDGRTPDEVAARLGTTVGSVYTAKCRVFTRIRKIIAELDEENPPIEPESLGNTID